VNARLVGRDIEIDKIFTFLSGASRMPAALAITGDPGIGKTEVWKHVLQAAAPSCQVLSGRPTLAERPLAFSALDDLFGDVAKDTRPALAGSRRWAVAARRALDGLRVLSSRAPLIIAVDDAQWLDRSSARVLEFCVRRLDDQPVSILVTFRTGDPVPLGLDRVLPFDRLCRVPLGPLSMGAIGELLRTRLGAVPPRRAMTRLYDACAGNPFYALEFAGLAPLSGTPGASVTVVDQCDRTA
jgi:predicted ATPase